MIDVTLVGFYGSDESHALSAWTSTNRELTDEKMERLGTLLKRLATDGHHTPFEKSSLHFLVTCDVASHIHLIKHRIGVSINAESARYKELKAPVAYIPVDFPSEVKSLLEEHSLFGQVYYHKAMRLLMEAGMSRKRAKESARYFLGYNNMITSDVMFNFRSFMHFQGLRNKPDAQDEIRMVAHKMLELTRVTGAFDKSLEAFGYGV